MASQAQIDADIRNAQAAQGRGLRHTLELLMTMQKAGHNDQAAGNGFNGKDRDNAMTEAPADDPSAEEEPDAGSEALEIVMAQRLTAQKAMHSHAWCEPLASARQPTGTINVCKKRETKPTAMRRKAICGMEIRYRVPILTGKSEANPDMRIHSATDESR